MIPTEKFNYENFNPEKHNPDDFIDGTALVKQMLEDNKKFLKEMKLENDILKRRIELFNAQCAEDDEEDARFESEQADFQDNLSRQIRKIQNSNDTPLMRLANFIAKVVEFIFNAIVYVIVNGASFGGKIIAKPFKCGYALVNNTCIE